MINSESQITLVSPIGTEIVPVPDIKTQQYATWRKNLGALPSQILNLLHRPELANFPDPNLFHPQLTKNLIRIFSDAIPALRPYAVVKFLQLIYANGEYARSNEANEARSALVEAHDKLQQEFTEIDQFEKVADSIKKNPTVIRVLDQVAFCYGKPCSQIKPPPLLPAPIHEEAPIDVTPDYQLHSSISSTPNVFVPFLRALLY